MNDHNCNKKRCLACGKKAVKYGFQSNKQRWKCLFCGKVFSWKRNDVKERNTKNLFTHWITDYQSLSSVAKKKKVHRTTLTRRFKNVWSESKQKLSLETTETNVLILDGLYISRSCVVLVVFDSISNKPLIWGYAERENTSSWMDILNKVKTANVPVSGIVSDGQKGLILAVRTVFPKVPHQRCIIHVIRLSLAWLTRKPQTDAGVRLRELVISLSQVKTKYDKPVWIDEYENWLECFEGFLKEKSINPLTGRTWYTHRKLRAVHSLIKRALPNLFVFLEDSQIPSTTNKVEGGINAPLVELLHRHRGTNIFRQKVLVSTYLSQQKKKKLSTTFAT
jgi:transposase-like protein